MQTLSTSTTATAWRLQDAKAQFSELVDNAMRGVPQHVTRRGKQAVVVLSEQEFEALQRSAGGRSDVPMSFVQHLLAIPKIPKVSKVPVGNKAKARQPEITTLDVLPRHLDFS